MPVFMRLPSRTLGRLRRSTGCGLWTPPAALEGLWTTTHATQCRTLTYAERAHLHPWRRIGEPERHSPADGPVSGVSACGEDDLGHDAIGRFVEDRDEAAIGGERGDGADAAGLGGGDPHAVADAVRLVGVEFAGG